MNLGSPDSNSVNDTRKYLNEFLMDERVIDSSWLLRFFLVRFIIAPFRAPKSAHAYRKVWTAEGSPLLVLSKQLQEALQKVVTENVDLAMRYGSPSPRKAFDNLLKKDPRLEEVVLVPLYPHYAMSSYETAVEYAKKIHKRFNYPFKLTVLKPYYNQADYVFALTEHIRPWLLEPYDHILFSYHGIPERHLKKSDPTGHHCLETANCCGTASSAHGHCYRHQCLQTTKLVTDRLPIQKDKFSYSFQSRLGREEWLKPYTDFRLEEMPKEGIKKLLVICPAFVSDCLETLEEIAIRGKESFLQAGGESFKMIPCLNTDPLWVRAIGKWIGEYSSGSTEMLLA
jgi:ferrochelatase